MDEDAGSVVVCYDVLSGRIASRSIHMRLRTFQEEAQGDLCIHNSSMYDIRFCAQLGKQLKYISEC